MAENYHLLLSARSLAEGREEKNYLLRIYLSGNAPPIQIDNCFTHNYEYVFKLWPCGLNEVQSIQIQMFEKFVNQANRQILVKRGESKTEVHCTLEGEKFKFYGEQEKSLLILHFRVESTKAIERQMSNQKLKQMNRNMEQHLKTCKEELKQYQDFLIYTNNVIKELNETDPKSLQPTPYNPTITPQDNIQNNDPKELKQIRQTVRENQNVEPSGNQTKISTKSQPKRTQRQLSSIKKNEPQSVKKNEPQSAHNSEEPRRGELGNSTEPMEFTSSPLDKSQQIRNQGKESSLRLKLKKDSARMQQTAREKTLLSKYRYLQGSYQVIDTIRDENESEEMSDEEESAIEKEIEVKIPDRKRSKEQEMGRNKQKDKSTVRLQQNSQSRPVEKTKKYSAPKPEEKKLDLAEEIRKRREQYFGRTVKQPEGKEVAEQNKVPQNKKDSPINKLNLSKIQNQSIFLKKEPVSNKGRNTSNHRYSRNDNERNELYVDDQKQIENEKVLNSFKEYEKQYKMKNSPLENVPEPSRKSTISKPRQNSKLKQQSVEHHEEEILRDNKSTIVRQSAFPSSHSNKKTLENNSTKIEEDSTFKSLSRRKKISINRESTEKERTTMGRDEDYKKESFVASKAKYQQPDKNDSNQELSLCRLKAVLFTNNRSLPKRCLVQFQRKTFQTNVKESEGNMVAWSANFHLEGINQSSFLHCTVISSQDNRVKEEGETLIKGSDILDHKGSIIKAYLYKEELAVGYLELEFTRGTNVTDRKTISLPEIKKRSNSQLDPPKKVNQIPSMRAKTEQDVPPPSQQEKKKLSTISQCGSSEVEQCSMNSQKSSLSRLKERKLRLRAKMAK